jgi:hypothetical protein
MLNQNHKTMVTKKNQSEVQTIATYKVALTNSGTQPVIASEMAQFGYTSEVIAEGKVLLSETLDAFAQNRREDDETRVSYADFDNKSSALSESYTLHRKKARVVFRNDDVLLKKLALKGRVPKAFVNWVENMRTFYTEIVADPEIQNKLARLKFPKEEAEAGISAISELETSRSEYLRETGESQEATQAKDAAFAKLDKWMQDFYAVAKIAMDEKPQLLEALGVLVRN